MRHIPFIHQLCSHLAVRPISIYIQNFTSCFFHVVFTFCPGTLRICYLRMRSYATRKIDHHLEVILSLCGTYWYEIQRGTAIKNSAHKHRNLRSRSQRTNFTNHLTERFLQTLSILLKPRLDLMHPDPNGKVLDKRNDQKSESRSR